ncbi:helicase-associated domain-containing protein [Arthrobacter sp. AQ5-05]|uniref:helicase-associated domain-containing protein n=1 Tax=Arthrobacter sp. AQ5-05 TaxID=2184581 RepID=UPI0012B543CB|nr:helicase-associated domain-containing protein [Arthrobacter sp. AQ5-05]
MGQALTLLESTLPAAVDHFLLRGDLTAVAPGYLLPELAAELALLAHPEGRGMAAVFRFSAASLNRVLAVGYTAEGILGFLTRHASTPVPPGLHYLNQDCAPVNAPANAARQRPTEQQGPRSWARQAAGQAACWRGGCGPWKWQAVPKELLVWPR